MVDFSGIDIHAPQQTHPKCSTRASGLWPSPPFNANIVFRGQRQPFISILWTATHRHTMPYYCIAACYSMLQRLTVYTRLHSPSPDILTISRCLWMSLVLAFSHQCVPFRWSHGPGTWRPMWPVPGISAFVLSKLGETWITSTGPPHIFTYLYRFFTISILALGLCSSIMLQLMGCASVWLWLPANRAEEQFQQWLHKGDDFLHASLSFLNQPACSFIFSDKAKEQSQDIGA